jgi:hypothetical protein
MILNAGGGGRCGLSASKYSCAHEAQINFGDLTPYLAYTYHFHSSLLLTDLKVKCNFCATSQIPVCKRLRSLVIDSASVCSLTELIPGLLKRLQIWAQDTGTEYFRT